MSKIFGHASKETSTTTTGVPAPSTPVASGAMEAAAVAPPVAADATAGSTPAAAAPAPAPPASAAPVVDVAAILDGLAAKSPEKLQWKTSIVDLMKLVGMESSLAARKELATDLKYTGDQNDSATMNIWLHKEVMLKLSENGGKVPQELLK